MRVFHSDRYSLSLPEGHRFPMEKYRLLRERLLEQNILSSTELIEAPLASYEEITLAHDPNYVRAVFNGTLDDKIQRKIGFPWSETMPLRSRASVGGFIAACEAAIQDGVAGNLSGGTHHAHFDSGGGFCVFNDFAVATHFLKNRHQLNRVAIIDLDVHQGDGNSSMLKGINSVFIFSMHGEKNYPFKKIPSDLDIGLPEGCDDETYLSKLKYALEIVIETKPQIILYQAGVDPLFSDTLGKLNLSFDGLKQRDAMVLKTAQNSQIPIALALGGGYARPIDDTISAHLNTYRVAKEIFGR